MVEKKVVVDAVRFTYSGMLDVQDLFKEVDEWAEHNGDERETKKKLQHVEENGKKLDYIYELWKELERDARSVVRLRILIKDLVDFTLERESHIRNMQKGHLLVIIDGFVETDLSHRWSNKPWYVFLRTIVDKIFWRYWIARYDGYVTTASFDLFNRLHRFIKKYKY